jgi:hypothetical protein
MALVTSDRQRQAAAPSRLDLVLCSIQEAHELIEQARQTLSPVASMAPERKRLGCVSRQLTRAWFAVVATANRSRRRSRSALPGQ